jgi:hypothetical protein
VIVAVRVSKTVEVVISWVVVPTGETEAGDDVAMAWVVGSAWPVSAVVVASATGQTVVEIEMVSVVI